MKSDEELSEMDDADLWRYFQENPDFKSHTDFTVKVGEVVYLIPNYCLTDLLWGMPDDFYPCSKYEWADHPVYFTTIEMVKQVITEQPAKFKAFILYK